MTPAQFEAIAQLCRLRQSASREAARLVLVDGLSMADASKYTGITLQGASQAVLTIRRGMALAKIAIDNPQESV